MLVGLTVEKGVGPGVPVKEPYVIRPTWVWNPFFQAMFLREADRVASSVIARTGMPLTVAVRTHYVNPKSDFLEDRYALPSTVKGSSSVRKNIRLLNFPLAKTLQAFSKFAQVSGRETLARSRGLCGFTMSLPASCWGPYSQCHTTQ